jgi:hypothetical protein
MYKLLFLVTLGLCLLLLYSANTVQAQTSSDIQEAYDASSQYVGDSNLVSDQPNNQ